MLRACRTAPIVCVLALLALLVAPTTLGAQTKPLPDGWFFPNRPEGLKSLEGKPVPELKLSSWIGDQVRVSDMKGKVVVIDFWATWCGPCMAAIPKNVELVKKYKDQGLVFLGVHDAASGWDSAQAAVDKHGINYPVARDADGGVSAKAFNLSFWPTYVVVDRNGIVRGAGLNPNFVGEAVKMLLAEAGPASTKKEQGEFPDEWFYGGETRTKSTRAMEGKPMPPLTAVKWRDDSPLTVADMKDRVVVLHFFASGNVPSMRQAETLAALEKEMGPQGVVVVGVIPSDEAWDPMLKLAEEGKVPSRLFQDAEVERTENAKGPAPLGATAAALGVRYLPATIVIDRAGKVRATSVRAEKVKELAGKLLAENLNKTAQPEGN